MKKIFFVVFVFIMICLLSLTVFADKKVNDGVLSYTIDENGDATVVGVADKYATEVVIPEVVTITAEHRVISIAQQAFQNNDNLVKVTVEAQIKELPGEVFCDCSLLETVVLPDSIEVIGRYAFFTCHKLSNINLPASLKEIGYSSFSGTALKNISFPEGVETIGERAFKSCSSLTNVLFPSSLKNIRNRAFQNCTSLTEVSLPEGLEYIGINAFSECTMLEKINIPQTVTYIGDSILLNTAWERAQPDGLLYLDGYCIDVTDRYDYKEALDLKVKEGTRVVGNFQFPCYDTYGEWLEIPAAKIYIPASVESVGCLPGQNNIGIGDQGSISELYCLYVYGYEGSAAEAHVNTQNSSYLKFFKVDIFKDVSYDAWYYDAVEYVDQSDDMRGMGDGSFKPNAILTREELITIMYRVNGENEFLDEFYGAYDSYPGFSDVPEDMWYTIPIKWAKRFGYTVGIGNGEFGLGQAVTREQMATVMIRVKTPYYEELINSDFDKRRFERYEDSSEVSEWAVPYVTYMIGHNYMEGVSKTKAIFAPKAPVTRAEAAQVLYRARW